MKSNLSTFIAFRYFFSRKSQRVINLISMISSIGVTIGTAALIIVLSVFNGFEDLILRLYDSFDPDLRIELKEGKTFDKSLIDFAALHRIKGVNYVSEVIDESALARYRDRQYIIRLKGVSEEFEKMSGLDTMMLEGKFKLQNGDTNFAVIGSAVAYNLGVDASNIFNQVEIFAPRKEASVADPEGAFNRRYVSPAGVFSVQQEFDTKYILVPLRFASEIFDYENRLTSIEIKLLKDADEQAVIAAVEKIAGNKFIVKDRSMQHETLYKIMRSEKWAVFLILTFILIIAIFNVISSLTMLVIEKKKDIVIFRSMGAEVSFLRRTFMTEGMMITMAGTIAGLTLGFLICMLQQHFGFVKLSGTGTFIIDAYPVKMSPGDFIYVFLTVTVIGMIASWYPARRLIREKTDLKLVAE